MRGMVGALLLSSVLACSGQRTSESRSVDGQEPWQAPLRLEPPDYLPPTARSILRQRMGRHARDMRDLVMAVLVLDRERAGEMAGRIAADVDLARPLSGDATELNALIPSRFFDLQDDLRRHAGELALAARRGDQAGMSKAYAAMSESCVDCHTVYRDGPGAAASPGKEN